MDYTKTGRNRREKKTLRSMYVGTNGKISFSIETDTVKFMMSNLISDID